MTPRALYAPARLAGLPLLRTQTDERLVDLVRAGNDGAFEAIVARYRRPLLAYCSGLLPEGRAEDAVQQTFLRAFDALRASDGEMALRPWLYRIAHNVALNALRDRSLRFEELSETIDGVERPDQAFEKSERLRDTVAAVGALPERQRDAVVLRELEGRSYDEIATELGVTDGAVRQLLNRARGTLRAGVTALTPYGLLARLPSEGGDMGARIAEVSAAGAAGAVLTKVAATALVTGAVVGGVASAPSVGPDEGRASDRGPGASAEAAEPAPVPSPPAARSRERRAGALSGGGSGTSARDERSDSSGPGSGSGSGHSGSGSDSSGPGSGSDDSDSSGPGSSSDDSGSDSSGPGSGSGGSSGPGSGTSGSGSTGSGSSGSSGSGSSGSSGSGSSGSGSSGSGSDSSGPGSDSSGSGSGSDEDLVED